MGVCLSLKSIKFNVKEESSIMKADETKRKREILLGINPCIYGLNYHDPAVVVLIDGRVVFGVEEERCNRVKHSKGVFPSLALAECLTYCNLTWDDIDAVVIGQRTQRAHRSCGPLCRFAAEESGRYRCGTSPQSRTPKVKPRFVLLRGRGIPAQGRFSSVVKDRSPEGLGTGGELGSPWRSPPHVPSCLKARIFNPDSRQKRPNCRCRHRSHPLFYWLKKNFEDFFDVSLFDRLPFPSSGVRDEPPQRLLQMRVLSQPVQHPLLHRRIDHAGAQVLATRTHRLRILAPVGESRDLAWVVELRHMLVKRQHGRLERALPRFAPRALTITLKLEAVETSFLHVHERPPFDIIAA